MSPHPSIPESLWNTVPPEARAAILAVIAALEKRFADLEARLNQDSTNRFSSVIKAITPGKT
jgi:transposase